MDEKDTPIGTRLIIPVVFKNRRREIRRVWEYGFWRKRTPDTWQPCTRHDLGPVVTGDSDLFRLPTEPSVQSSEEGHYAWLLRGVVWAPLTLLQH